jgi:hypothetical protein
MDKLVLNQKKIKEIESYKFQIGIFDNDLIRSVVIARKSSITLIPKLSARLGQDAFRRVIDYNKKAKITNSNLLQWEKEKGRNYLSDCFNPRRNINVLQVRNLLLNFKGKMNNLNMQKVCQMLVKIWRDYVESNPYGMHNDITTIQRKGADAWLRDTRQLQKSVSARFLMKERILTVSIANNIAGK